MKHIEKIIGLAMLIFAIGFNLWLYRLEPTALVDPNDNSFQFALVDRTKQIFDFASKKCSINILCFTSYLVDHWVPNWAQGYNLPFYYSHIPQILIVASWRLLPSLSLFTYYHWVIYFLMCLFPLSVFLALRVIRLPWLAAGIGALMASQISTDGFYGFDPASFLWRGWGLSSQLFAMIWMPLAIAYSWRFFMRNHKTYHVAPAALFLTLTAMGHLGMGVIILLSLIPLALAQPVFYLLEQDYPKTMELLKINTGKLIVLGTTVIFFLSYWIIPILLTNNYHNISFWDPVWKFNSYGAGEVLTRLLNGNLFDFGRFPWMTTLVFVGIFVSVLSEHFAFTLLFLFWLLLYFGRTTWGWLIDLIPTMTEFHISRFIVGVHLAGLFLVPIAISWFVSLLPKRFSLFAYLFIGIFVYFALSPQTIRYGQYNDVLIRQANDKYHKDEAGVSDMFQTLRSHAPARVYAGRGGNWGKDFKLADTPIFMHLSTYGIPTVLWLPETWSPNSDIEQYFSEDVAAHYDLFNLGAVIAPPTVTRQPFWKLVKQTPAWNSYTVETSGYITGGVRVAIVGVDKRSYINVVRLWIQSDAHKKGLYPELTFAKGYPRTWGLPNFKMIDEVTYKIPDGSVHNLFAEPPRYFPPGVSSDEQLNKMKLLQYDSVSVSSQEDDSDMIFKAKVTVGKDCAECIVVLKQSFHPNWRATIDGKPVQPFSVFPVFTAVPVSEGTHDIVFSYKPSRLKVILLVIEIGVLIFLSAKGIKNYFLRP